jgi:hypothetical protein
VDGRDKPGHDGNKSSDFLCSWGEAVKRHRSRDAAGIRGLRQAARKRHETSAFERPVSEAGGGVRPFIPIQARKAKKKAKKEGRRNAGRRVVHDPRFGAARADRSALACRRSTTALAAANERRSSTPATRFL